MTTQLASRAQIDEITAGRDLAISKWVEAYDTHHALVEAASTCCVGGSIVLSAPTEDRWSDVSLTRAFLKTGSVTEYDRKTGIRSERPARDIFIEKITHEIDRRCWSNLLDSMGFDQLLDRQAREELRKAMAESPAPFTTDNCAATFGNIWDNRRNLYLRGIANTFMALDRRFRSHDGFKIGGRLIINRALSEGLSYWVDYNRRDTLRDVERVFRELDGLGPCPEAHSIAKQVLDHRGDTPKLVQGQYFRVRVFGNGNIHLWFERKDLLVEVNKLLAEYYGEVIGDGYGETKAPDAPEYHITHAKDFGEFHSSPQVADAVMRYADIRAGETVLEPSAGTGMLAKAAREAGGLVACVEVQHGLAHELRALHGFADVRRADFLRLQPGTELFDVIVMNPPFDRGRDCDHVRHALQFLKPGGRLIAVMSARAEHRDDRRHKALHDLIKGCEPAYGRDKWHDLPPNSFAHAGTNVNTVILALRKPI